MHIADEILAGNRLGDPTPTPSEILRKEEEREWKDQEKVLENWSTKTNKELNLSLELAGIKAPPPKPHLRDRAVLSLIQMVYRKFMQAKKSQS
ncbi:hypothetical protein EVAR_101700_1 [Eumeta japonica]|uniref:Uncharacterized protein n=1 Tax=Eumeta variegata TaxID=151549 RepID=A0A4C1TD77_EUMVA|nr:hypothetical protein EVAR_101700_1 [Eumeta japonica]